MVFATHQQQRRGAAPGPGPGPAPPDALPLAPGDRGIDVSSHQPNVDWAGVASTGRRFAFVKATEGTSYVNPYFARDWQGIREHGMVRGTYHFARPATNSATAEVSWFLRNVGELLDDDLLVLDTEDDEVGPNVDLAPWTLEFLHGIRNWAGRLCWVYSGPWYLEPHNLANPDVAGAAAGLWLAAYVQDVPAVPRGWESHGIGFWQYTDKAVVTGAPGTVDDSIYRP